MIQISKRLEIAHTISKAFRNKKKTATELYALVVRTKVYAISYPPLDHEIAGLADFFKFRACLAGRYLCSQNVNKYSNKPTNGHKRII